jgi:hypothetical protein
MQMFFVYWAFSFAALMLAFPIAIIIYQLMGDGIELNGWRNETITALCVSAAQAGGHWLSWVYLARLSTGYGAQSFKLDAVIFALSFGMGYLITHLTSWDSLEYMILGLADGVLAFAAFLIFCR